MVNCSVVVMKPWFDSPEKPNLVYLIAMELACRNDEEEDQEVMCSWCQLTLPEREKLMVWGKWNWDVFGDCWGWVVNLFYCLRWVHWQRGVECLGSQGSYLTARKPPWDESRMNRDGWWFYQKCLPSPPSAQTQLNVRVWWGWKNVLWSDWKEKYVQGQSWIRLVPICQVWNSAHDSNWYNSGYDVQLPPM